VLIGYVEMPAPRRRRPQLGSGVAFVAALMFGAIACASVAAARLNQGNPLSAGVFTVAVVWASIMLALTTEMVLHLRRFEALRGRSVIAVVQLAGLVLAAVAAHAVLHLLSKGRLVECTGQFVNDSALALPVLAIVWAGFMRSRRAARWVEMAAIAAVALYAGTQAVWHFDPFPGAGVQQFVALEAASTLGALWLFDVLRRLSESP